MKIKLVDIKKIKDREGNPNVMNKKEMEALKKSIERFGDLQPVLIDQNNVLIDGHQRKQAYEELGKLQVPAIQLDLQKESDKKLLSQIMNKVRGTHAEDLDALELKEILKETDMEDLSNHLAKSEQEILNLINKLTQESKDLTKDSEVDQLGHLLITCPACSHKFKKKDGDKK